MRRSEVVIGGIILGIGVLLLLGSLFNIDVWGLICPAGLIALGILLIYRTRQDPSDRGLNIKFVGDIRRKADWVPQSEETWGFVLECCQGRSDLRGLSCGERAPYSGCQHALLSEFPAQALSLRHRGEIN